MLLKNVSGFSNLSDFVQDKNIPLVENVIQSHLVVDIYEGLPRTKNQIKASAGGMCGEARHEENKTKVGRATCYALMAV